MKKIVGLMKNEYIFAIIIKVITLCLSVVNSAIVARFLGASLQGTSAYIQSITTIGSIVVVFGMNAAYPYFRKKYGKDSIFQDYMSLMVVLHIIYFIVLTGIGFLFWEGSEILMALILIPIIGYASIVEYILLVEAPNKRNLIWLVIYSVEVAFDLCLFMFVESNELWVLIILLFAPVAKSIWFTCKLKVKVHVHKGLLGLAAELFKFGFFPMLALLLTTLNYRIDVLMLKSFSSISEEMIGIYSIGISISDKIIIIPDTLKGIMSSKLSRGADAHEVARVSRLCFIISIFCCILLFVFGRWGIDFLYGQEYSKSYEVILITMLGTSLLGHFKFISQYSIINKKHIWNTVILSISVGINVIANLFFISMWGINGAALATSLGHVVCGVIFIIWFCNDANVRVSEMFFLQKEDKVRIGEFVKRKR